MLISFFSTALPSSSKGPSFAPTFDSLKAVSKEERSLKFLVTNEFLHQFKLLHPLRSIAHRDLPSTPSTQVTDDPALNEEAVTPDLNVEPSLKKCSGPVDGAGSSKPVPTIEAEGFTQRTGKAPMGSIEEVQATGEDETDVNKDDASMFDDLSNIISSQELIKDATPILKPSASVVEVSIAPIPTPPTQALSSIAQTVTIPRLKSGLLLDACSLHFAHT